MNKKISNLIGLFAWENDLQKWRAPIKKDRIFSRSNYKKALMESKILSKKIKKKICVFPIFNSYGHRH